MYIAHMVYYFINTIGLVFQSQTIENTYTFQSVKISKTISTACIALFRSSTTVISQIHYVIQSNVHILQISIHIICSLTAIH